MVRNWIRRNTRELLSDILTSFAELDFGEIHGLALNDARLGFSVMPVWSDTDTYTL